MEQLYHNITAINRTTLLSSFTFLETGQYTTKQRQRCRGSATIKTLREARQRLQNPKGQLFKSSLASVK